MDIYHLFDEKIDDKPLVLVHASVPINVLKECPIKIKDNNINTEYVVWARENDPYIPFKCRIGSDNYFTIVGHTPNNNKYGYKILEQKDFELNSLIYEEALILDHRNYFQYFR